jgi:hypothetical protein
LVETLTIHANARGSRLISEVIGSVFRVNATEFAKKGSRPGVRAGYLSAVIRGAAWLSAAVLLGTAPYQCKSNDPERAREDTTGEALWQLCGRFAAAGDDAAARKTLDYLIERYPSSREAKRAKEERDAEHPCKDVKDAAPKKPAASSSKS